MKEIEDWILRNYGADVLRSFQDNVASATQGDRDTLRAFRPFENLCPSDFFYWDKTEEGSEFWEKINDQYCQYLEDYGKLRSWPY